VLVTLRIHLSDGRDRLLAAEVEEQPASPEELLERFDRNGEIAIGDRESVPVDRIVRVEFAPPEPQSSPPWLGNLHDEDVESAMEGRFDRPPNEDAS
jgi:hypothetical protein